MSSIFIELVHRKKDKVRFDIIREANREYISVTYGCIRFFDGYRFSSYSLDELVETLDKDEFDLFKKKTFPMNVNFSKKVTIPLWLF